MPFLIKGMKNMDYEKPLFDLDEADKKELVRTSRLFIYGDADRERMFLHTPNYYPRFARLSRKLFIHYLGERYNPHTFDLGHEIYIRQLLHSFLEAKVFYQKKEFDREYFDNYFKKVIGESVGVEIPYDKEKLEREALPKYRVQNSHLGNKTIN